MAGVGRTAARIILPVTFCHLSFSSKSSQAWLLATRQETSTFALLRPSHGLALPHSILPEPFWEVFWSPLF